MRSSFRFYSLLFSRPFKTGLAKFSEWVIRRLAMYKIFYVDLTPFGNEKCFLVNG